MRKPDFCICENKGADQLCSDCTADQHLCFRYSDSTISSTYHQNFKPLACFCVQADLCRTWSETLKFGFLASWVMTCLLVIVALATYYRSVKHNECSETQLSWINSQIARKLAMACESKKMKLD